MGSGAVPSGDQQLIQRPSPNFGPRREGARLDMIVLHYTAMASAEAACARLCDPEFEVSAHYVIGRDGTIFQLVDEDMRAWHAGAGQWREITDVNSRSIGIELDNDGFSPFSAPLMDALEGLLPEIMARWGIPAAHVIGHSDMAPGRKHDPGARFDWARLVRSNLAVGSAATGDTVDEAAFWAALDRIGYPACDADTRLSAFRLRHNQGASGPLSGTDCARALTIDADLRGT
ncbi:MAG: N-acetylmuramoyl-L-alanine amidase [Pseudomonadota bacterium]